MDLLNMTNRAHIHEFYKRLSTGTEESAVRPSRTLSQGPRTYTHCTCDVRPDK